MSVTRKVNQRTGAETWLVRVTHKGQTVLKQSYRDEAEARRVEAQCRAGVTKGDLGVLEAAKGKANAKAELCMRTLYDSCLRHGKKLSGWKESKGKPAANASNAIEWYFGWDTHPLHITDDDVTGFVEYMEAERGSAEATVNRYLAAMSVLLQHGVKRGFYSRRDIVCFNDHKLTEFPVPPRHLREDEYQVFHDACTALGVGGEYFICLLDTGLRCRELAGLHVDSIEEHTIMPERLKGGHAVSMRMPDRAMRILRRRRAEAKLQGNTTVFAEYLPYSRIRADWQRVKALMGLANDKRLKPHSLRHTCAIRMVGEEVPIQTIQQWLGHACITTSMLYAKYNPRLFDSVANKMDKLNEGLKD